MTEDDIRAALDAIQPPDGAQDRMYQNVLKKASQQQAKPKASNKPVWSRYAALAAMLAVVITAGAFWFRSGRTTAKPTEPEFMQSAPSGESSNAPMLAASPFEDVQSAADFEQLGFTIDAPEGASEISYCIAYGATAQVDFTLNSCAYLYEASAEKVFSDSAAEMPSLYGGDAVWQADGVQYRLHSSSAISEQTLLQLAMQLAVK